ncbi:RhoGAP-domain-containing protein [Suillus clintonianus]|uniref:RhoGAP-domain-containing protein n=1 Tax=Suillus clintonianus TaxID=1904413 RepID=UPI001B87BB75|nr:RhoGAP-domain-containing protein [Suillus clintonianus]KAG2135490.1 RhoGAP-domain-containing protein [Suillus clintonianus]
MSQQVALNSISSLENRICPGCKQYAVNENGGLVVAFGQSFFHVDCFKCAKCHQQVTADTNLLLLSDGSPICANCSYNCNVCNQPILDEAIMTGDDSYHAHCFNCKVCHNRIDELVFAKTSHGIYCMTCHNERMAKIRRHAQRKREREKAAEGSASSSTREREAREFLAENVVSDRPQAILPISSVRSKPSATTFRDTPSMRSLNQPREDALSTLERKRKSIPHQDEPPQSSAKNGGQPPIPPASPRPIQHNLPTSSRSSRDAQSQSFAVTIAPPDNNDGGSADRSKGLDSGPSSPQLSSQSAAQDQSSPITPSEGLQAQDGVGGTLLSPVDPSSALSRRKSYDDGVRPLNILFGKKGHAEKDSLDQSSLGVPITNGVTSRSEKRRSINPGLALDYKNLSRPPAAAGLSLPEQMIRSQTLPANRSDSPIAPSPSKPYFSDSLSSRRASNISLLRDNASGSTIYHSPPPSPAPGPLENGRATPDIRMRSMSHDHHQPQSASHYTRPTTPSRRTNSNLEKVSTRPDSHNHASNSANGLHTQQVDGRLSPSGPASERTLRLDNIPSGSLSDRSGVVTPTSPSHRADVPHGIESGTDTDVEGDSRRSSDDSHSPTSAPPVPPKEYRAKARANELKLDIDPDVSVSHMDSNSDESSPVERTSVATFIAPALLPPIRFSMTGSDFSDFLRSVGGMPSLKSLDQIAEGDGIGKDESLPSAAAAPSGSNGKSRSPGGAASVDRINGVKDPLERAIPTASRQPHDHQRDPSSSSQLLDAEAKDLLSNLSHDFSSRSRSSSESHFPSHHNHGARHERLDSTASLNPNARIVVTSPDSTISTPVSSESYDLVIRRLHEVLDDASEHGYQQLKLDKNFIGTIITTMKQRRIEHAELKHKYDGTKRASQQYIDGLTVAQKEHDRELVARRNAEAEVTRMRILLTGQAAKLTALNGEEKRSETRRQVSQDLAKKLDQLEHDLSHLKAERDMTLAELEELCASKNYPSVTSSGEIPTAQMSRSLTMRLDNIKTQYKHELIPLTQQREALIREVGELKAAREQFLEETTVLNARNEELAQLSAQYVRRIETSRSTTPTIEALGSKDESAANSVREKSTSFDRERPQPDIPSMSSSLNGLAAPSTITLVEDSEAKFSKASRPEIPDSLPSTLKSAKFKWPMGRGRDPSLSSADQKGKGRVAHSFNQSSVLRFTRCDHCGDKLWGSQFRCSVCHISVHPRCLNQVYVACSQQPPRRDDVITQPPPSMFGRDLVEQVKSDSKWGERRVPIIVEKCIDAVEALALDYEGIYRKTGGTGQTKVITQLFERGDYGAFDLRDDDRFNDICSVTSVLKTYFRQLPVPLLTFDLHGDFISAAGLKDAGLKNQYLQELINRLPSEHYHTLRLLVLHLHRVLEHSDKNLMNARNLGVVFGPTLMRSSDPGSEFSDMAGKALMIEWLVDNAPSIFQSQISR